MAVNIENESVNASAVENAVEIDNSNASSVTGGIETETETETKEKKGGRKAAAPPAQKTSKPVKDDKNTKSRKSKPAGKKTAVKTHKTESEIPGEKPKRNVKVKSAKIVDGSKGDSAHNASIVSNIVDEEVNDRNDGRKKILFMARAAAPFITTGGLGEVVGSLPKNLCAEDKNADVRVVMPLYKSIKEKYKENLVSLGHIYIDLSWRHKYCGVYKTESDGIIYYFIDNNDYFGLRDDCYGYFDDGERFAFFGKAVLDILEFISFIPDIIHMHDWQSAVASVYLKTIYYDKKAAGKQAKEFRKIKTVFTIHNMEYQGKYNMSILEDIFGIPFRYKDIVDFGGEINLMKGAMICSDIISTVSPTYAKEIHDFEFAHKLEPIVNMQTAKIRGILNGIDYDSYNPKTDSKIFANYDSKNINNKIENKLQLQTIMGMKRDEHIPVIVMITRLTKQKGLDLLSRAIDELGQMPLQLMIFGTGAREYELLCESFGDRYPDKIMYKYGFNGELARRMYAGADMLLMPSDFEPCGISQMIAARYGTVPLVSATGGLKDTVTPYNGVNEGEPNDDGIGFVFSKEDSADMTAVISYACSVYNDGEKWREIVKRAMNRDFSWGKSAKEYIKMYNGLLGGRVNK